jgi:hypothetical protein
MPYFAGPKYWNSDLAAEKKFAINESQNLDLRITAKNFLNHDLLSFYASDPNLTLNYSPGPSSSSPNNPPLGTLLNSSSFGYATAHYGQRLIELSAKYTF